MSERSVTNIALVFITLLSLHLDLDFVKCV